MYSECYMSALAIGGQSSHHSLVDTGNPTFTYVCSKAWALMSIVHNALIILRLKCVLGNMRIEATNPIRMPRAHELRYIYIHSRGVLWVVHHCHNQCGACSCRFF